MVSCDDATYGHEPDDSGSERNESPTIVRGLQEELENLKWQLWNGNLLPVLQILDSMQIRLDLDQISEKRGRLLEAVRDFGNHIAANQQYIVDYGDRYRNQERGLMGTLSFLKPKRLDGSV